MPLSYLAEKYNSVEQVKQEESEKPVSNSLDDSLLNLTGMY